MATKGVHLNIYKAAPNLWRCDIKINTSDAGGGFTARGVANTEMGFKLWDALKGAMTLARQALHNPAVLAAFPAATLPALAVVEAFHAAKGKGVLGKIKKQLEDPTLRKVARELHEMDEGKRTAMSGGGACLCDGRKLDRKNAPDAARAMMGDGYNFLRFPSPHPWADEIKRQLATGAGNDGLAKVRAFAQKHPAIARQLAQLDKMRTAGAGAGAGEPPNIARLARMLAAQRALAKQQRG